MLLIELDIFSGRSNPRWVISGKEENDLVERVTTDPSLMEAPLQTAGRLGYRGFLVRQVKESVGKKSAGRLPELFRIGGAGADGDALRLIEQAPLPDEREKTSLLDALQGSMYEGERSPTAVEKGSGMSCVASYLTSSTDFSFWNDSSHVTLNNCYDYAANYRSNTFAQPGRECGHTFTSLDCTNIPNAIRCDGWFDACQPANNLTVVLVIWPGSDFHFYRMCQNGIWCHKPGQTPARNYDNSGNIITNPLTCDRGPYTTVCGYWYADNSKIFVT
jgi:hypothetical protein